LIAVDLHKFRWKCAAARHRHPKARPIDNSFIFVGGLDIAGLEYNDNVPEKLFFFRQDAGELWDALDAFQSSSDTFGLDILGSPGTGKSSEVWAWISCQHALTETDGNFAIWIHLFPNHPAKVVMFKGNSVYWKNMSDPQLVTFLESEIEFRFIILDGFQSNQVGERGVRQSAFLNRDESRTFCQVITVMSMGVQRSPSTNQVLKVDDFEVFSWSKTQYRAACRNLTFLNSVKDMLSVKDDMDDVEVDKLLEKKYHFAGGNARWMFAVSQEKLVNVIRVYIAQAPNVQYLLSGLVSYNSPVSSNQLMCRYKNGSSFISSKYVASRLLSQCASTAYQIAYALASEQDNPAFLGWVVEFDIISQMRRCSVAVSELDLCNGDGSVVNWNVSRLIDFDPDSFNSPADASMMPVGSWLKPVKWNQEAYDLAGLFREDERYYLRFVQITYADSHTADVQVFQRLATSAVKNLGLEIYGVEIIVLSPASRINKPTQIRTKNGIFLSLFHVGLTEAKWTRLSIENHIKFHYFKQQTGV
jgi:hypothetical protein